MATRFTRLIALVTILCMLFSVEVFAGKGSDCSGHKKGFFAKVGAAIKNVAKKAVKAAKCAVVKTGKAIKTVAKKTAKAIKCAAIKTGKAIKVTGARINNAFKDSGVWIKWKITGKKKRVWVVGHYDKNGKWIKGHWRKLTPAECVNNPGQANNPGQGEPLPLPPSDDVAQTPDAPPADEPPATEPPADAPPADLPSDGSDQPPSDPVLPQLPPADAPPADEPPATEPPAPPADEPPATEPPAPPADGAGQSGQSGQGEQSEDSDQASQSGDASQAKKSDDEVSLRTLGMLMNDIIKDSAEITSFKKSAIANPGMNYSMDVQGNVNGIYENREKNAALLVKVIVYDLNQNNGKAGKYFNFFTYKLDKLDSETRMLIGDVLKQVKEGVQHNSNNADNDKDEKAFAERMKDLNKY